MIGPASISSRHEMLSRPVALFGESLLININTSKADVCHILNIVETGFMYDSKFTLPLKSDEANSGPIDVTWSFKISQWVF